MTFKTEINIIIKNNSPAETNEDVKQGAKKERNKFLSEYYYMPQYYYLLVSFCFLYIS